MHPAYSVNYPAPPHPHPHAYRSWSDEHVPANHSSPDSVRPAPRSSSFSASRAPPPPKWNSFSPPPVPPLPSSLLPGFHSPSLVHANRDFSFASTPQWPPPGPQMWSGASPPGPSSSHSSVPPVPPQSIGTAPSWPSFDPRVPSDPSSSSGPSPVVPPRPPHVSNYVPTTPSLGTRRPSSYALSQNFSSLERFSSPPPAVPPRPTTAHGEIRFAKSPSTHSQSTLPAPPVPPKMPIPAAALPLATPNLPFPSSEPSPSSPTQHHFSPSAHGSHLSHSPSAQEMLSLVPHSSHTTPEAPEEQPAHSETTILETLPSDDLKHALTLSLAESRTKRSVDKTIDEEDDELARALAESLTFSVKSPVTESNSQMHPYSTEVSFSKARDTEQMMFSSAELDASLLSAREPNEKIKAPSKWTAAVPTFREQETLSAEELANHMAQDQILQEMEDEEVTRRLQEEESERLATELREREREEEERTRSDQEMIRQLQEEESQKLEAEKREREKRHEERARKDAALAWREETEERARKMIREAQERKDAEMARELAETSAPPPVHAPIPQAAPPLGARSPGLAPPAPGLPQYSDVVGSPPDLGTFSRPAPQAVHSAPLLNGNESPQQARPGPGRAISAIVVGPTQPIERGEFTRSTTMNGGTAGRSTNSLDRTAPSRSHDPSSGSSNSSAALARVLPGPAAPSIEPDLLKGVSYGFKPPDTQSAPAQLGELPPCPPFPEVISLFRAPSPPFHIMAPTWRHLMRLLAQLETRIEANLDAIARSKEDNHLRVVVQFVKLPYTANTWRTIVHLSIDEPIPRNTQNAWRFNNGDTTVLPYSYTTSQVPSNLIVGPLSQLYVIPLSATSPFPILPISLPNLALYLQSAMRDSRARKVQNDPSNGMRRLAKMMMACYPEEVVNPDKEEKKPSRGVGGLFKRVVGRGGGREDTQGNEDVYDIITPFRIDQYTVT